MQPEDKQSPLATLRQHRFFAGMDPAHLAAVADCATPQIIKSGVSLGKEGAPADHFFVITGGNVAIETYQPSRQPVVLQTLKAGDIVGWSWLFPPYQWVFDARATSEVQALAIDGRCLRGKCDADTRLGYDMMKRLSQIMTTRLKATRMQLLDLYGSK